MSFRYPEIIKTDVELVKTNRSCLLWVFIERYALIQLNPIARKTDLSSCAGPGLNDVVKNIVSSSVFFFFAKAALQLQAVSSYLAINLALVLLSFPVYIAFLFLDLFFIVFELCSANIPRHVISAPLPEALKLPPSNKSKPSFRWISCTRPTELRRFAFLNPSRLNSWLTHIAWLKFNKIHEHFRNSECHQKTVVAQKGVHAGTAENGPDVANMLTDVWQILSKFARQSGIAVVRC